MNFTGRSLGMEITTQSTPEQIQVRVNGRIDTNTSPPLQAEIMKSFQKGRNVILDFAKVDYISSAGLRALLLGHKTAVSKGGSLKIIHVPEIVREVFAVTGFDKILNISDE